MALGTAAADKGGIFVDVNSGLSLYFQVKMKKSNEDISHAYPVVGEGINGLQPQAREANLSHIQI